MPGVEPITEIPQPPPVQPGAKLDPKDHTVRHIDPRAAKHLGLRFALAAA